MTVSWTAISKDSIEGMDFLVGRQDVIITTYEALVSTEDIDFFVGIWGVIGWRYDFFKTLRDGR